MEQRTVEEQAENNFMLMLHTVSRKCTTQEKKMLQVLLRNTLSTLSEVQGVSSVRELLYMLTREGHLNRNNLDILYECIKLINSYHVEDEIKKYYTCPDIKNYEIKLIPKERQAIMACGKALAEEEINALGYFYILNINDQCCDVWDFLLKLEDKLDISRDKTKMDQFMSDLKKLGILRPLQDMKMILNERPVERPRREIKTETRRQKGKKRSVGNASRLRQAEIPDHFQQRKYNQPTMVLRSNCPDNGRCSYKKPRMSGKENTTLV